MCDKISDSKFSHDVHVAIHENEIQFSCDECEFECDTEGALHNHIASHHTFTCKDCNFTSKTAKHLYDHSKTHNGNKLSCPECEYTCQSKNELKKHRKKHTGEKLEPCKKGPTKSPIRTIIKKAALRNNSITQ